MTSAIGLPPLLNTINNVVDDVGLLVADAILIYQMFFSTVQWGIFNSSNRQVLIPDSIVAFDFTKEYRIADYPMEQGAFQSYNKVTMPYDAKVSMTKGGSVAERAAFLTQAALIAGKLDFYTIVTPEIKYLNANIARYDYRRTSTNGVGLVTVDFWLKEVRVTVPATFSNTVQPTSVAPTEVGYVQTGGAPVSTAASVPVVH